MEKLEWVVESDLKEMRNVFGFICEVKCVGVIGFGMGEVRREVEMR